ncbi:MAG: hypothetical protein IJU32_08490 [Pyramidobacter sp.]|nr:hypothetical protein [Pyramidobacter sp.]
MLTALDLCQKARLGIGDAGHTAYSDYECLTALQSAVDMLVTACDEYFSPALVKSVELELENETAELPEDFRSIVSVLDISGKPLESNYETGPFHGEYRFANSQIISPETPLLLIYRYRPARITALEDEIDIPEEFGLVLARITAAILTANFEAAQALADKSAQTSKLRRWENAHPRELWGGYNRYA